MILGLSSGSMSDALNPAKRRSPAIGDMVCVQCLTALVLIAVRVFAVPVPGALEDFAHGIASFPVEAAFGGGGVGDELGRVAFAARGRTSWDRAAGDFAAEVDDFLHAG